MSSIFVNPKLRWKACGCSLLQWILEWRNAPQELSRVVKALLLSFRCGYLLSRIVECRSLLALNLRVNLQEWLVSESKYIQPVDNAWKRLASNAAGSTIAALCSSFLHHGRPSCLWFFKIYSILSQNLSEMRKWLNRTDIFSATPRNLFVHGTSHFHERLSWFNTPHCVPCSCDYLPHEYNKRPHPPLTAPGLLVHWIPLLLLTRICSSY